MIEAYLMHEKERNAQGIPALPLTPEQTADLCKLLQNPPAGKEAFLMTLFTERISPGVDPAAEVKAAFLAEVLKGAKTSALIDKKKAIQILGTMMGGYNVKPLIDALKDAALADEAASALSGMTLVYDGFDEVLALSKSNAAAKKVLESWANAEWFTNKPAMPETIKVKVYKVDGEINTDDFSPAGDAWSRPDIPLHALAMGKTRFPAGNADIAKFRADGYQVAFVGDVVGTGSSPQVGLQLRALAHRQRDPGGAEQEDRRRHHRRRHRADLLQHGAGLRRPAAEDGRHLPSTPATSSSSTPRRAKSPTSPVRF